jgi:hypothetical protein
MASEALTQAAQCYRNLQSLPDPANSPVFVGPTAPCELSGVLEAVAAQLTGMQSRVGFAFSKKRFGIQRNLAILLHLQYFVEAFAVRIGPRFPRDVTRKLSQVDIADLLEAGTAAAGGSNDVSEEAIGRALFRFRKNERNRGTCSLFQADAQHTCNGLKLHPAIQ